MWWTVTVRGRNKANMVRLRCAGPIGRRQGRNRSCVTVIGVIRHNNSAFARNRLGHAQGDIIGL